jgi:multiple sugar transport system substrate-binding protein
MKEGNMRLRPILAAALAGTLAVGAAGCGGSGGAAVPTDPSRVSGTVTMWVYPINQSIENTWWAPKVKEFQKKYSKVKIKVVVQPWANRDEQLTTAIAGGSGPDVVYLIPDQIPQYAATGALADVSDVISADRSNFRPNALNAMTYQKTLYGVPLLMSVTTTLGNKKVMRAAGISDVPKTWDEFLTDAAKLKKAGYYATEYAGDPTQTLNQTWYPLLWEAGGQVLSDDGKKAAFNSDDGVKAVDFVKELIDKGYAPKDELTTAKTGDDSLACQGKVAFALFAAAAQLTACSNQKVSDWVSGPPLADKTSTTYGTVGGLSLLAGSKNQAAAKAWIQWLTGSAQMKAFDTDHVYSSPRTDVGELFKGQPVTGDQERYLDKVRTGVTNAKAPRQLMDLIKPHLQAALLGRTPPKQALDDAAKDVDDALARG